MLRSSMVRTTPKTVEYPTFTVVTFGDFLIPLGYSMLTRYYNGRGWTLLPLMLACLATELHALDNDLRSSL